MEVLKRNLRIGQLLPPHPTSTGDVQREGIYARIREDQEHILYSNQHI